MSNTVISLWFLGIGLLFAGMIYLMHNFHENREATVDLCTQLGGISVIGDKGHYKICLRPEAVIELPKQ